MVGSLKARIHRLDRERQRLYVAWFGTLSREEQNAQLRQMLQSDVERLGREKALASWRATGWEESELLPLLEE